MKKIRFELTIEKRYKGSCSLDDLLEWVKMTEEEWNALTQEQQESLLYDYFEDEMYDIDRSEYDSVNYCIEIIKEH